MRRFYALGVLGATAVAAALGLKVTEARAELNPCPVPSTETCKKQGKVVELYDCDSDDCGKFKDYSHLSCGKCVDP